jgi:hypothetical protein
MVGKTQKSHGARSELNSVFGLDKVDGWNPIRTVFEKWVERCKKCIACQGRYFEKDRHRTSTKFRLGVIR